MAFQQKDNTGTLFKNDYKKTENHPDYRGKCMVNGVEMEMAAWIKEGKSGKFMSFAFSEPYQKDDAVVQPAQSQPPEFDDDLSDVPF